jgi:glutamate carboxypeptidase
MTMSLHPTLIRFAQIAMFALVTCATGRSYGTAVEPVLSFAQKEKPALIETMKALVGIESGSADREGLDRLAALIADRLKELGGQVEVIEPGSDIYRMHDTPEKIGKMVRATFTGAGTKKILLIAHMDTVYPRGMLAKQPFRIDGDRAYGLGIADDKQGIAVILHALAMLKTMNFRDYGTLTVLINGDEEVSSPASRGMLTTLGAEHDATFSFEASRIESDKLALATAGIAAATLEVKGKASHAGSAPEKGVNALYELAHQVLQARDLSDPTIGLKVNWTMAKAGVVRNMIPPTAEATADVRVLRVSDYDGIEQNLRERIKNQLLPEAEVKMNFERRRPPLEMSEAARALGRHAQQIYEEIGKKLVVDDKVEGGGTDAAFAALSTKAPVLERFGLQGFGAHSSDDEYVLISSIEPRLYLVTRLIMDVAQGKAPLSDSR